MPYATVNRTVRQPNDVRIYPLSRQQRDLISIFVSYLRFLPKWTDAHGVEAVQKGLRGEHYIIYRLLVWHFTGSVPLVGIPEADGPRFSELIVGAASTDPVALWRRLMEDTEQSAAKLAEVTASHDDLLRALNRATISKKQAKRKVVSL